MTYRPTPSPQHRPVTATSSKDCVAAVTAELIDRATVGRIVTDHAIIRKRSGAPATRGLYLSEAVKAAATFGVDLDSTYRNSRSTVRDTVIGGAATGLIIHTKVTANTTRRTNAYVGLHMIYLNTYAEWPAGDVCACEKKTATRHGEFSVEDPGTTQAGFLQWSADLVYRAAEAVGDGIHMLTAPDTERVPCVAIYAGACRKRPSTSAPYAPRLVKGTTYTCWATANGDGIGWMKVGVDRWARGSHLR